MSIRERLGFGRVAKEKELGEAVGQMGVFYMPRDFYSNPEVILITARGKKEALEILNRQLESEYSRPVKQDALTKLDLSESSLIILKPPGDRSFTR